MQPGNIYHRRRSRSGRYPGEPLRLGAALRDIPFKPKIVKNIHRVDTLIQQHQKNELNGWGIVATCSGVAFSAIAFLTPSSTWDSCGTERHARDCITPVAATILSVTATLIGIGLGLTALYACDRTHLNRRISELDKGIREYTRVNPGYEFIEGFYGKYCGWSEKERNQLKQALIFAEDAAAV